MVKPKPFVKYIGGKTKLLPTLVENLPKFTGKYFESFVGGGALLWNLSPKVGTIVDLNPELINCYICIKNKVEELIESLAVHKYEKDYFYNLRGVDRTEEFKQWSDIQRASRYIYLVKTCFNGVSRYNQSHQFNAPFGSHKNPKICDKTTLRACNKVLQNIEIICGSYQEIDKLITVDDFVYLDPPYLSSDKKNFTQYTGIHFGIEEHISLRDFCCQLNSRNIKFMLTNSSCDEVKELYQDFNINISYMPRSLNCKSEKRGKVEELIIKNY